MSTVSDTSQPVHVDSPEEFYDLLDEHPRVLVDYYADWCGPCEMLAPTIKEIAEEADVTVLKVDIEAHQELASEADVRSIPTIQFLADGEEAERLVGVHDKSELLDVVESL